MDIQTAKQIRLEEFLHSLGYNPVKRQGINLWYKSPFREETEASFKVNTERNQWYDFALGKGRQHHRTGFAPLCNGQRAVSFETHRGTGTARAPYLFLFSQAVLYGAEFPAVGNRAAIFPCLARLFAGKGYQSGTGEKRMQGSTVSHNGKRYFAIAFPNISGGYEIRNRYFKGCIAPKEISHIRQSGEQRNTCYVFEGFMDYLSFLTLRLESCPQCPDFDRQDYMVLNSVANVPKALYPLGSYERIHCFFDNDRAGMEALQQIRKEYDSTRHIRDASQIYCGCKDLNEYLQKRMADGKEQMQSVRKRNDTLSKKPKGFRL